MPSGVLRTTMLCSPQYVVVVREVEPAVGAAALLAQQRGARDGLRHDRACCAGRGRGSSRGCRPACSDGSARRRGAPLQLRRCRPIAALEPGLVAEDPDVLLHRGLAAPRGAGTGPRRRGPAGSASSRPRRRPSCASSIRGACAPARRAAPRSRPCACRTRAGPRASCRRAGWRRSSRPSTRRPRTGPRPCSAPVSASTRMPPMK